MYCDYHLLVPSDLATIRQSTIAFLVSLCLWDFPGGAVVKNPPANAGDMDLSAGPGRSHMPRSN